MTPLFSVRELEFSYRTPAGPVPALRGLSFDVRKGERLAIVGPSGSGKSTLLYFLGGMLRPDGGRVLFGGVDILAAEDAYRAQFRNRHVGFVFQQFHLMPRATVLENIALAARFPLEQVGSRPPDLERARELAHWVGLGDRLDHLPNQLSGGQQQRVALARALMNDPEVILADEPTGNLDSGNAAAVLERFRELERLGKTVVLITHDREVAAACHRTIQIRDGRLVEPQTLPDVDVQPPVAPPIRRRWWMGLRPLVWEGVRRQKGRALLTFGGISIGVAAVLSLVTVGEFAKRRILESYAELGVNTLVVRGHFNWEARATDAVTTPFRGFDPDRDIAVLPQIFPEVVKISPILDDWGGSVHFGGKKVDSDLRHVGVGEHALSITGRALSAGAGILPVHIEDRSPVCVLGPDLVQSLFGERSPLGEVVQVARDQVSFGCRVVGVLAPLSSNKEWRKPNSEIIVPYTFFQATSNRWGGQVRSLLVQVRDGADVERSGTAMQRYFEQKYGKGGTFRISSDTVLIAQMKRFLTVFSLLLGAIALVTLGVGALGVTNLMLVSLGERTREIGLLKALGATDRTVRWSFLLESILLCAAAGAVGLALGFAAYQTALWGASRVIEKVAFEWVWEPWAVALSFGAIAAAGIVSGWVPALRAERLPVMEALRAE